MPLVELLQNLQNFNYYYGGPGNFTQKSLPYDKDLPGGGSSGGPLVQFPLPENADSETLAYYAANRSSLDYPMRGASLNFTPSGIVVSEANKYDVQRISRFYKRAPRGYTFIAKQVGLQLTNPKLEVGNQANLNPGNTSARYFGVIENTRIYNGGLNTLTQVRLQGSGVHADRHGTVPYNPLSQTYEKVVASFNKANNGRDNRLVTLLNTKIYENLPQDRNNLQRLGIPRNVNTLFQYPGGPGSVYGIGLTTVPRYYNNNALYKQNPVTPLYEQTNVFGVTAGVDADGLPTNTLNLQTQDSLVDLTSILSGVSQTLGTNTGIPVGYLRVGSSDFNTSERNRLAILLKQLISGEDKTGKSPIYGAKTVQGATSVNSEFVYKYDIGDSIVTLWRAVDTVSKTDTTVDVGQNYLPNNNARTLNSSQIYNRASSGLTNATIADFRNELKTKKFPTSTAYQTENINTRLGVSNPGMIADRDDITKSISTDAVSMLDVGEDYNETKSTGDLIRFKFEAVEYTAGISQQENGIPIIFRAYLTGLQDNHAGEFNSFRYTGRGENFYNYNGFTRSISFNFKVAVQSRSEMRPLYRKLNYLISQLYPDYSTVGFMRAPLIRMTIGDYISRQPGFLTSINVTVGDDSPWEINLENKNDIYQLPHVVDVSCQFTPIHNFLPSRSTSGQTGHITPFITPADSKAENAFQIGY